MQCLMSFFGVEARNLAHLFFGVEACNLAHFDFKATGLTTNWRLSKESWYGRPIWGCSTRRQNPKLILCFLVIYWGIHWQVNMVTGSAWEVR